MAFEPCPHERSAVRARRASRGEIFARQCLECGALVGSWLKRDVALGTAGGPPEPWDEALNRAWEDRRVAAAKAEYEAAREAEERAWRKRYRAHLRSLAWAQLRAKVFQRSRGRCEGCGEAEAYAVHHLTYAHLGAEFLWEVVALCDPCHARVHGWGQKAEYRKQGSE